MVHYINNVGKGGGGGAGGVGKYAGVTCNAATAGGRGSYNPGDTSVYGPGDTPDDNPNSFDEILYLAVLVELKHLL